MPTGIFNPFAPKKKKKDKFRSPLSKVPVAESGIIQQPSVTLDGDSYSIKFTGTTQPKDIALKLVKLLLDVNIKYSDILTHNGINVYPTGTKLTPDVKEMVLSNSEGILKVFVGDPPHSEVPVYRRIAYTLRNLPIQDILEKHQASLIERG
jgi:hypothetical protein